VQGHEPRPLEQLGQGLNDQPVRRDDNPCVGASEHRAAVGQRSDLGVSLLAVDIHQIKLDVGCRLLAGTDEPEISARPFAAGGNQAAGISLLGLKSL
jgi:hypothetical protein